MTNSKTNNSSIDQAIRSLERTHQLKKEEIKSGSTYQILFKGSDLFTQPVESLFAPMGQIQGVLKESTLVIKGVSDKLRQEAQQDPWTLLAKVAVGSLGLGLIISRRLSPKTKVKK